MLILIYIMFAVLLGLNAFAAPDDETAFAIVVYGILTLNVMRVCLGYIATW